MVDGVKRILSGSRDTIVESLETDAKVCVVV